MNYYLIDIDTEIDFNKIIIGDVVYVNDELQKVYIYYLDDKPKEILIKIPPIRLIYSYKNLKYNQIRLPIYPNWEKTIKFIKFIKKLEKFIKSNIKCNDIEFINSIEKNQNISSIKLNINPNIKINSLINTTLNELKTNSEVECIINISFVWIKKTSYGLSLSCYQLKYTPKIDYSNVDFFDEVKPLNKIKTVNKIIDTPIPINTTNSTTDNQNNINKPLMLISSSILNAAITKLNKIK
jgi:hypothetical protein